MVNNKKLSKVNQKILQENQNFPIVTLKDGTPVQTGTVAVLLYNIQRYNGGERGQIEEEMRLAIPILFKIGFFELFPPNEWISKENFGGKFCWSCSSSIFNIQANIFVLAFIYTSSVNFLSCNHTALNNVVAPLKNKCIYQNT